MPRLLFAASLLALAATGPAHALSTQECSAKYQAAKEAGTLGGQKWNEFRKAQCGPDAEPAAAAAPAPTASPSAAPTPAAGGAAIYPTKVDPKYASEKPGRARMKTCVDQYNANKAGNGNGGLKWIEKGGGYYSECNKRLKG